MIELGKEDLMPLSTAARRIPGRKPGAGLNPSTLWRWAIRGVKGVKLETLIVGGTRYTSAQALQRFVNASTAVVDDVKPAVPVATVARRKQSALAAERELIAAGM